MYYHRLNTSQDQDVLIYEDKVHREWMFSTDVTIDGKYLINSTTKNTDHINLISYADISSSKLDSLVKFTPLVENWVG